MAGALNIQFHVRKIVYNKKPRYSKRHTAKRKLFITKVNTSHSLPPRPHMDVQKSYKNICKKQKDIPEITARIIRYHYSLVRTQEREQFFNLIQFAGQLFHNTGQRSCIQTQTERRNILRKNLKSK